MMQIPIHVESERKMYLRNAVAEGTLPDGTEFEVTSTIPDSSLLFRFKGDDSAYRIDMRDCLEAVLNRSQTQEGC
jgi:hypothetical protein